MIRLVLFVHAGLWRQKKSSPVSTLLKSWGFRVKIGRTVGGDSLNYFSGTDDERLDDLQEMLDDEKFLQYYLEAVVMV